MKLVTVEYTFDHSKMLFYFTADGRVDFRELVKDLAGVFRTRIELRQIGVRDEAKMIGGLGICGCTLCCSTFLDDFQPVSINMAKDQGLSLNPSKISGTCGRLMCCLKYENEAYQELIAQTPPVESLVETPQGRGTIMDVSLLKGCCKVRLMDDPDTPVTVSCEECKVLRYGKDREKKAESSAAAEPKEPKEQKEHKEAAKKSVTVHRETPEHHEEQPAGKPEDGEQGEKNGEHHNRERQGRSHRGGDRRRRHSDRNHSKNGNSNPPQQSVPPKQE